MKNSSNTTLSRTIPVVVAPPPPAEPAEPEQPKGLPDPPNSGNTTVRTPDDGVSGKPTTKKVILSLGFPEEVAEDVRFVAYVKGVSLSQFVLSKITPTLDAEVQAVLAARTRRSG